MNRLLLAFFIVLLVNVAPVHAAGSEISGSVFLVTNQDTAAIPGITIHVVSSKFGKSIGKITDNYGRYTIRSIPNNGAPYFLEAYADSLLIYRKKVELKPKTIRSIHINR